MNRAALPIDRWAFVVPAAFAAAAFLIYLVPGLVGPYGPFIDELYYVSCAERPALGYVDHPPLAPLALRTSRAIFGDGMLALRLPPALAGALVVLGIGLLARRFGAGRVGQVVAGAAALIAPAFQILFGFYSMNPFEILIWLACTVIVVEIACGRSDKLWLAFGLAAGLGLLSKHTLAIFGVGLGAGLLLTPARRHLVRPWLWLGALIAAAVLSPNLVWQVQQGWPSLEFYRNADLYKNLTTPPHMVLLLQALFMNPGTLPVWVAGIVFLLRRREGPDLRHLGWMAVVLLVLMAVGQKSRPDRITAMYPMLLAAGGVAWEAILTRARWARVALPVWLAANGIALAPLGIPLLPPPILADYAAAIRVVPQIESGPGKKTALPQWFADRLGWEQLVSDVAAVRDRLPAPDRERVVFFAPSYGQAGALDWLGRDRGLAPVHCSHNNWFLWGPPPDPVDVAIVVGFDPRELEDLFEDVEQVAVHDCDFCMPWRDEMPIWICRRARGSIAEGWKYWKHFE